MTPFDYINSINNKSGKIKDLSDYSIFLTGRAYSFYTDTILYANALNWSNIPANLHYRVLYDFIPKKNRFTKWPKKAGIKDEDLQVIMRYYNYNMLRAREVMHLLSKEDIDEMRVYLDEGGK